MSKPTPTRTGSALFWITAAVLVLLVAIILAAHRFASPDRGGQAVQPVLAPTNPPVVAAGTGSFAMPVSSGAVTTNQPGFQLRPFPVSYEGSVAQWTSEDGKDTNVIRRLAHNDLEYARMLQENDRIQRRQLVYRKDTTAAMLQRVRASGEPVTQLTLPGLDGQELTVAVDRADLEPSWQSGTFTGRLANHPNSMVTLAFKFGRESFTILSPDDGLHLQAWPREPGQVIITSFDPDVYLAMPEGEPIMTTNTFKIAQ